MESNDLFPLQVISIIKGLADECFVVIRGNIKNLALISKKVLKTFIVSNIRFLI